MNCKLYTNLLYMDVLIFLISIYIYIYKIDVKFFFKYSIYTLYIFIYLYCELGMFYIIEKIRFVDIYTIT